MRKQSTSKLRTVYGMSIAEMVKKYGNTRQAYYDLHYRGRLKLFLSNPEKFRFERYSKIQTKYVRVYGMKQKELHKFLGLRHKSTFTDLHKAGLLQCCIDSVKHSNP